MSNESYATITRTEFGRGATFRSAKKLIENWFILNKPLTCKPVSFTTDFFFNCGLDIWLLGPIKLGKNKWKQRLAGVLVTILLFLTWAESLTQKNGPQMIRTNIFSLVSYVACIQPWGLQRTLLGTCILAHVRQLCRKRWWHKGRLRCKGQCIVCSCSCCNQGIRHLKSTRLLGQAQLVLEWLQIQAQSENASSWLQSNL